MDGEGAEIMQALRIMSGFLVENKPQVRGIHFALFIWRGDLCCSQSLWANKHLMGIGSGEKKTKENQDWVNSTFPW